MRHDVITALDAINGICAKMLMLQQILSNEQDIKALSSLMTLAIEYITQLNLMLLWSAEELNDSSYKVQLTIDAVYGFVEDVDQLRVTLANTDYKRSLA